jgi:hypothetical protein
VNDQLGVKEIILYLIFTQFFMIHPKICKYALSQLLISYIAYPTMIQVSSSDNFFAKKAVFNYIPRASLINMLIIVHDNHLSFPKKKRLLIKINLSTGV